MRNRRSSVSLRRARGRRRRVSPESSLIPTRWIAAKVRRIGRKVQVMFRPKRKRNVAAGFYDEDGVFHPIRASHDYSARRAGEKRKRKPTKRRRRRS